ncbi:MAG: leucine-rich repeat protein [Alistipes sp.]|nr:leucine-rich repeat protein [Alistipes sp.]
MKKLLLLLALVGMVAYGCTDSSTDDDNKHSTEQPGPSGDEDLAFTNNTNTAPTISHEGGTAKISFTAALSWSVSVYADWLSVSDDEGEAGNGSFVITAEANDGDKERKGVVAIKLSNNKSYEITVKQSFNADGNDIEFINNTNTTPHMEYGGGTVQIAFIAKTDWTVTCYADWLSTSKSSGSKGENSFFITAASNPKEEERSGVVAIKSKNNKSYEIKVTQDPNAGIMQLTVAANEVLYTTVFDTQIKLYNESGFGGNLISHSYDVEKGYGSIRFDNYVTSIPSQAFKDCATLESIYLPEGVTYIAPNAFEGCTNLKYIISPNSTNYSMFIYNGELMAIASGLTDVTIPKEVKIIDRVVFQSSKVENLTLYASTSIDAYAFENNKTLKTLTIKDEKKGNGYIGNNAFEQCSKLTNVSIGEGVTFIGSDAFYQCPQLTNVSIGGGGTELKSKTFYNCSSLTSLTLENGVTRIGDEAFYGCNSLTSVTIPDSITFIGNSAFSGCSSLKAIYITDIAKWCGIHFNGTAASPLSLVEALYLNGELVTDLVIPNGVESIKQYAFYDCHCLKSITIPNSVTSIGGDAFYQCAGELTVNCNIPSATTSTDGAFYASEFTKVTIGDSVTSIGNFAFWACHSLKGVYCKPTTPPTGGPSMFSYIDKSHNNVPLGCKIYVPTNSVSAYKAAEDWRNYRSYIVGYDF